MAIRRHQRKEPKESALVLAIAAVEGQPNAMDMDMAGIDPSPGALDLPEQEQLGVCSRCGRRAVGRCPECGSPVCCRCLGLAATNEPK